MKVLKSVFEPRRKSKRPPMGVKLYVPMQSMSIAEMLRRFVRREALPVEHRAVYADVGYDLEKISKMDPVEQDEVLSEVKERVSKLQGEYDAAIQQQKADAAAARAKKKVVKQKDPKEESPKK